MDDRMRERFWKEFYIQTQTESKEVAFANPADAANALISSRNWYGTISEELASLEQSLTNVQGQIREIRLSIQSAETAVLSTFEKLSTATLKNQQTISAFVRHHLSQSEREDLDELELTLDDNLSTLADLERQKAQAEIMRRAVERTADWLVQYINWQKFEMREF
jgi:chromosome segregation ATPase